MNNLISNRIEWSNGSVMIDKNVLDLIYLVSCAVNNKIPDMALVEAMNLNAVYDVAAKHMLAVSVAMALESAGYKDDRSQKTVAMALRRTIIFENALKSVRKALEENNIWFMPLKGAVLKDLYPTFGMREFADYDILFDASREDDVHAIMSELGYFTEHSGAYYHNVYCKRPFLVFEMHTALFSDLHYKNIQKYYQNIEQRLIGDGLEKRFNREDMYLYLIAHEYKHYFYSGTGLRSMVDTYLYLNSQKMDMDYVAAEAEKLGIADFEKQNRSLSLHLFGEGELTPDEQEMLEYIISSGAFGTRGNHVENKLRRKHWSKLQYAVDRFFVPISKKNKKYNSFAAKYPLFYKHRILLPVLPFYRVYHAIKIGSLHAEVHAIRKAK